MMKNSVKSKIGTILASCGLLMLVAALALVGYNICEDNKAGNAADEAALGIQTALDEMEDTDDTTPLYKLYPSMEMHTLELDGNTYIGLLEIPDLGLSLPVMSKWSYPNLRTAPCRYSGSAYTGDLVIAAHNFKRHFGNIKNLRMGSTVVFTDMSNNKFKYTVSDIEELAPTAIDDLATDESCLTLFTCNMSGSKRIAVRCIEDGDDV
jgi:sortase A